MDQYTKICGRVLTSNYLRFERDMVCVKYYSARLNALHMDALNISNNTIAVNISLSQRFGNIYIYIYPY